MKKLLIILTVVLVVTFLGACSNISMEGEIFEENVILAEEKDAKVEIKQEVVDIETESTVTDEKKVEKNEEISLDDDEKENTDYHTYIEEEMVVDEKVEVNDEIVETEDIEVTTDLISDKKLIATGSTTFNPNQINRSSNIRLAASHISGLILNPGEEFSFNKVVGKRTAERGFLAADVFSGNSVVQGIGGGICQTSTTLCIAVKQSSMKILEQNPHSQRVTYASYEDEAMISYGTSDFRFVNTYEFPVMIEISFEKISDREMIKCDIFGLE